MEEKIIQLNYNRTDFEEIFFRNGNDKVFFNSRFDRERYTFTFVSFLFIATLIYTIIKKENFGFLVFNGIMLSVIFYDWYPKISALLTWKKENKIWLDELEKILETKIILTENTFSLIQDKKETIEKWSEFNTAEIEENYISLKSNLTNYIIPKKSMNPDDFFLIKTIILEKIKSEL